MQTIFAEIDPNNLYSLMGMVIATLGAAWAGWLTYRGNIDRLRVTSLEEKVNILASENSRLKAECEILREHSELLTMFAELLPNMCIHPVVISDGAEQILAFNKQFLTLTGYTDSEMFGAKLSMFVPESYRKTHSERLTKRASISGAVNIAPRQFPLLLKDGTLKMVSLQIFGWTVQGDLSKARLIGVIL